MARFYNTFFTILWFAWLVYWFAPVRSAKATARQETAHSRLTYLVPLLLAFALLWLRRSPIPVFNGRFVPLAAWPVCAAIGAVLALAGLLFTVWARVHLGTNWSAVVTVKEGHELITSGPYRIVRHPIYTGLVLTLVGQALALGEWRGLAAVVLAIWAFWRKLNIEERWMLGQFGREYEAYSRRVAALIPFLL